MLKLLREEAEKKKFKELYGEVDIPNKSEGDLFDNEYNENYLRRRALFDH
jgi:cytidylate kinase